MRCTTLYKSVLTQITHNMHKTIDDKELSLLSIALWNYTKLNVFNFS